MSLGFEMQPALSSSHISSLMIFWYLSGMGYCLCAIGGPVGGMSISNRLVLPTFIDDVDMMEWLLLCNNDESLSQASWGTWASSSIIECLVWLFVSG